MRPNYTRTLIRLFGFCCVSCLESVTESTGQKSLTKERRKNIMLTPWGVSSHQTQITDGVWLVETARHGGILVRRRVAHTLLSPEAMARGKSWGSWLVYEEDCDWSLFAYEQPLLYAA